MKTEQLVKLLDNSEQTRIIRHIARHKGTLFVLDAMLEHLRHYGQHDEELMSMAAELDTFVETWRHAGVP